MPECHVVVPFIAQDADELSSQGLVKYFHHRFAVGLVAFGDCALFHVLAARRRISSMSEMNGPFFGIISTVWLSLVRSPCFGRLIQT